MEGWTFMMMVQRDGVHPGHPGVSENGGGRRGSWRQGGNYSKPTCAEDRFGDGDVGWASGGRWR